VEEDVLELVEEEVELDVLVKELALELVLVLEVVDEAVMKKSGGVIRLTCFPVRCAAHIPWPETLRQQVPCVQNLVVDLGGTAPASTTFAVPSNWFQEPEICPERRALGFATLVAAASALGNVFGGPPLIEAQISHRGIVALFSNVHAAQVHPMSSACCCPPDPVPTPALAPAPAPAPATIGRCTTMYPSPVFSSLPTVLTGIVVPVDDATSGLTFGIDSSSLLSTSVRSARVSRANRATGAPSRLTAAFSAFSAANFMAQSEQVPWKVMDQLVQLGDGHSPYAPWSTQDARATTFNVHDRFQHFRGTFGGRGTCEAGSA
jgi:hypothetical protein